MYSYKDYYSMCESNESEDKMYEESNENEEEIDSDIEVALYSQIHHLENPYYESTIEETKNSETKDYLNDKNNDDRDESLNIAVNKDKITLSEVIISNKSDDSNMNVMKNSECLNTTVNEEITSSAIIISDESNDCNVDISKNSDIEFICEVKSKDNNKDRCQTFNNNAKNCQKKWWKKFISLTYDNDIGDNLLEDDKNIKYNRKKKRSLSKLRHTFDLESSNLELSCQKNKTKKISTSHSKGNTIIQPSKRKRSDSMSSEDNVFKYPQCKKENRDILINVKPVDVRLDLTRDVNDIWKISPKDMYKEIMESLRYYNKRNRLFCNNCSERGHISRDCKSPRKLLVCYLCGNIGHQGTNCLNPVCRTCLVVGHSTKQCKWAKLPHPILQCSICNMWDHLREDCPDTWRRYHMTTTPGPIIYGSTCRNSTVYCYNCAREGHFGHECERVRMDVDTFPTSPFISHYTKPVAKYKFVETNENKDDNSNRRFKELSLKKQKLTKIANKRFARTRKRLQKKAERSLNLSLKPSTVACRKPKKKKKKTLPQNISTNEINTSLASSSQEVSNASAFGNLCIPQRKKRTRTKKANSLLQQTEICQENKLKKSIRKKNKKLKKTIGKPEIIHEGKKNTSSSAVANFLKCLAPELNFSMACMKLFSN